MSLVLPLQSAGGSAAGVSAVGGKGASLGELARAGVAVPPGFVVTTDAFAAAMAAVDPGGALRAEVAALPAGDLAAISAVTARFRARIAGAPLPDPVSSAIRGAYARLDAGGRAAQTRGGTAVAVRSSATVEDSAEASFAGLQDSYLGVCGASPVLDRVRRCWASLYNDEAAAYRRRLGMPETGVAMAVVVQCMVAPRAAGVMFTRSPVTGDRSVVAIEGTWGLGSALVSGDVTPDSFVISKITGEITGRRVSSKLKVHRFIPNGPVAARPGHSAAFPGAVPDSGVTVPDSGVTVQETPADQRDVPCLTDAEIRALAAIAGRVEAHYGAPQDIEWAVLDGPGDAGERIVLLQSRPETVWAARTPPPAGAPRPRPADHVLALFGKPL